MLRVALIEDEKAVLKGMAMVLSKEKDIELVGTAEDGEEGLELICREEPDLVFTDIRMPEMTGLEMIERTQKLYPNIVFVIFSGFNEFKYVQKAIGLGVLDYLEKPVTIAELRGVLERARGMIEYKKNYLQMKERTKQTNRILVEQTLYKLLNQPIEMEKENLENLIRLEPSLQYSTEIAVLCTGKLKKESVDSDEYRKLINALTFSLVENHSFEVYTLAIEENLLFVYFSQECLIFPFYEKIMEVKRKLEEEEIFFFAGLSNIYTDLMRLKKAFSEARDALTYSIFLEAEDIIRIETVEYQSNIPSGLADSQNTIGFNFRLQDYAKCRMQLNSYMEYLKKAEIKPDLLRHECVGVITLLKKLIMESGNFKEGHLPEVLIDEVFAMKSADDMIVWTKKKTDQFISMAEEKKGAIERPVKIVRKYIDVHFAESITLEILADQVHMNPTYLSVLFKKEEGVSYSHYLTEVRIKHAMEMLQQGEKAKEVCAKVGYFDYRYFNKQFKKFVGMTPDTYKRSKMN